MFKAPGLTADWLHGWLAALGITVLVEGCRLGWTDDLIPMAVLEFEGNLPATIARLLPDADELASMVIGKADRDHPEVAYKLLPTEYQKTCRQARMVHRDFSLGITMTDLAELEEHERGWVIKTSQFYTPLSKGGTLWARLNGVRKLLPESVGEDVIRASLKGEGEFSHAYGLGFNVRQLAAGSPPEKHYQGREKPPSTPRWVDPVIEILAFYGLAFFPVRGTSMKGLPQTRGWQSRSPQFSWPVWAANLEHWAIDAMLGGVYSGADDSSLGVRGRFEVARYKPSHEQNCTRGYGSRWLPNLQ